MTRIWLFISVLGLIALVVAGFFAFKGTATPKIFPGQAAAPANSCPNANNAACFDCNGDGHVTILDFSCFSGVYGKEY